jgi:ceramide glucosyltransferase
MLVSAVTSILTIAGILYFIAALWSARAFLRRREARADFSPGVSILKPVKGLDPEMYEAFASHCTQEYSGDYEILFGASSLDDPAVPAIERLQAEFPARNIRLVLCPEQLGANGKVSNVAQMAAAARYGYMVVNDSDIRVSPRYLARILGAFATPQKGRQVGLVTAPYRGRAHSTLWSRMEAVGISTDFFAGVLVSLTLDGEIRFGLGSTLAISREALDRIGGFASLADTLADDYELGRRVAAAGYAVHLSREAVETSVPAYDRRGFFAHQLRWARAVRDSRRLGYAGLILTFGLPWAMFNALASGFSLDSFALLSIACLARVSVALAVGVGVLGDRKVFSSLWLIPLRDLAALWIWVWSFAGDTIEWRGQKFELHKGVLKSRD